MVQEFVEVGRGDAVALHPSFDDHAVITAAIDLDVRAREVLGVSIGRQDVAGGAYDGGAALDLFSDFNQGRKLHFLYIIHFMHRRGLVCWFAVLVAADDLADHHAGLPKNEGHLYSALSDLYGDYASDPITCDPSTAELIHDCGCCDPAYMSLLGLQPTCGTGVAKPVYTCPTHTPTTGAKGWLYSNEGFEMLGNTVATWQYAINALTPLDTASGMVPVVVTNDGVSSLPFSINLNARLRRFWNSERDFMSPRRMWAAPCWVRRACMRDYRLRRRWANKWSFMASASDCRRTRS